MLLPGVANLKGIAKVAVVTIRHGPAKEGRWEGLRLLRAQQPQP